MAIAWDDSFAIGDDEIDADHRAMMALIGRLQTITSGLGDGEAIVSAISQLRDLCFGHFLREEALQHRIGFPDIEAHRLGHQMLLKRLDAVLSHFAVGCDQIRAGILRTLGDSLATWMVFHITRGDIEMRPYVEATSRRRRGASSRRRSVTDHHPLIGA
ncbi:bacteriohemerythrin [Magnetospirillum fulvum]|uniref:Hemerythrin-like protein n=1 Tax=Magnetospirillum fulvum MGU-K5 TaxID=1316936 RepID=S9SEW4_MAGFU|nr:hemerythrin family protein [Magnetospirillum fulvum]EPY03279.1 hemerythrin-like protein [Magnetospirillum fulvum MGU-K5]